MKKIIFMLFFVMSTSKPANAGWIATMAALDASDKATQAKNTTDDMAKKLDQLIDLIKQDHERIDNLENKVKMLTRNRRTRG